MFADINPLMRPVKNIASITRQNRKPAAADNPFVAMEKEFSSYIDSVLDIYRDYRDLSQEQLFQQIYGSEWLRRFFPPTEEKQVKEIPEHERADYDKRIQAMEQGGVAAGIIRIVHGDRQNRSRESKDGILKSATEIAQTHKVLSKLRPAQFKKIMHEQTAILQADEKKAINALSVLIKNKDDRMEALSIARRLFLVDGVYNDAEKDMLEKIKEGLKI